MHPSLEAIIFTKWPDLYRSRNSRPTRMNCFEHGDGWWAIIDALSRTVTELSGEAGQPVPAAFWSKEKWAILRWSLGETPADQALADAIYGAQWMAEEISACISEQTGEPACPWSLGGYYSTCTQREADAWKQANSDKTATCFLHGHNGQHAPISILYTENGNGNGIVEQAILSSRIAQDSTIFAGVPHIHVPQGLSDIAAVLLRALASRTSESNAHGLLERLEWNGEQSCFVATLATGQTLDDRQRGTLRMASLLGGYADVVTGILYVPSPSLEEAAS